MNSRKATTAERRIHIDADIDVEIVDESALTLAALSYVDAHPWDEAADQAIRRNEAQHDPIMAVLELWNAGEVIDSIPGLKSGVETVTVSGPEQHDDEPTESDKRDVTQLPRLRLSAERIRSDAVKATGLTLEQLGYDDGPDAWPDQATARKEAATLAGALWNAAIITTDEIFSDVAVICQANDSRELGDWIIPHLPEVYRRQYTPIFAKRVIHFTAQRRTTPLLLGSVAASTTTGRTAAPPSGAYGSEMDNPFRKSPYRDLPRCHQSTHPRVGTTRKHR